MMFTGTSQQQDTRFSDKEKKLLKQLKFGDCLNRRVDMSKVKLDVIRPWISKKITDLLHMEDDVVVEFVYNQLEEEKYPCPKKMQINMTGFLNGKNARHFMDELWALLLSAQDSTTGIPKEFIDQKKEEILKREQDDDPNENRTVDDSLANAVSREEAVMKQIEKIKESARVKDEVAQKTNSIVLAKADEISEKLNREKLKQLANSTAGGGAAGDKDASGAEEKDGKPESATEKEVEGNATNNNNRKLKSKSPESRIRSRNYRGRSRHRSKSRDKSPNAKSAARHENNHRAARNRSRSYDRFRRRSRSRGDRRSRSRDRKENAVKRRNESPRGRNRKDRSPSRDKPARRGGRSRSRSPVKQNRGGNNKRGDTNDSKRGKPAAAAIRNRSRERDRRPRDKKAVSRSVSPPVVEVNSKKNKNKSVSPERKRRSDPIEPPKLGENKRDRSIDRTKKRSTSRQRDNSTARRPSVDEKPPPSSSLKNRRRKSQEEKGSLKPNKVEHHRAETNGKDSRRRPKSIERPDEAAEEEEPEERKRSPEVRDREPPRYNVHDSSLSRTPSPFLSAAERNPQLMVGTLAERLALKRKERGKVIDVPNSSSDEEEPPKQKAKVAPVEPEESSSSKKLKKAKKSKKSRKSKKHKKKRPRKDSSDSAEDEDDDEEPPPPAAEALPSGTTKENRDALEKQLRERALKSMRKQKLSD